jgi:lysophospholipase L1-like esterase
LVLTHVPTPDPARMDDAIRTWMAAREAGRCAIARGLRRSALVRLLWDHAEAAAEKVEQVRLTRRLAFRMVEASREAGVPLLIANLPVERWLRSRSPVVWLKRHLTDRILRDLAAEAGVPVVDVWPDFRAAGKGDGLFIADGHYSPAGHAVVADALERALARLRQ